MRTTLSKVIFLAILMSGLLAPVKSEPTKDEYVSFSLPKTSLETFVDNRFTKLAARFQDQINELKIIFNRFHTGKNEDGHAHGVNKRQAGTKKPRFASVCESSSSLCTFYHPDHPDAKNRKMGNGSSVNSDIPTNKDATKFEGMPKNCKDLQQLGHKLNGIYLIKVRQVNGGSNIETVYCNFQSASNEFQTRIGVVDVKTSPVEFHLETKGDHGIPNEKFTFERYVSNLGNGFDLSNHWFRAPYNGTYFFSLSGSKEVKLERRASLFIKLNGKITAEALSSENTFHGGFSCQISRKLNAGDRIEIVMSGQSAQVYLLYFTGWMLQQDLYV